MASTLPAPTIHRGGSAGVHRQRTGIDRGVHTRVDRARAEIHVGARADIGRDRTGVDGDVRGHVDRAGTDIHIGSRAHVGRQRAGIDRDVRADIDRAGARTLTLASTDAVPASAPADTPTLTAPCRH